MLGQSFTLQFLYLSWNYTGFPQDVLKLSANFHKESIPEPGASLQPLFLAWVITNSDLVTSHLAQGLHTQSRLPGLKLSLGGNLHAGWLVLRCSGVQPQKARCPLEPQSQ